MIANDRTYIMNRGMEVEKAWAAAVTPGGDSAAAINLLSDDFRNLDQDGDVMLAKHGTVDLGRMMYASFADDGFVVTGLSDEGDYVTISGHNEEVHTVDLDLS